MPHSVEEPGDRVPGDVLPMVGGLPLAEFLHSDDSALARAVRRVRGAIDEPGNYAAHGSSPVIEEPGNQAAHASSPAPRD